MTRTFALNWDYRCPFARVAHEHVLTGLAAGADWDVQFVAFALDQVYVEDGAPAVWERVGEHPGLLPNLAGIAVRDQQPEAFLAVHRALFKGRHERKLDLRRPETVAEILTEAGADAAAALAEVESGRPAKTLGVEHAEWVGRYEAFGVPTFLVGGDAVFVRLMNPPEGDADRAVATIERTLDLMTAWPELNEFKHTTLPR